MKTLNVLIASSDRTTANRIEATLRDVCFERVHVESRYSPQIADFEKHSRLGWNDLTILSPDNLLSPSRQRTSRHSMAESLRVIRQIRQTHLKPIIAFGVAEQEQATVQEAGVDAVLGPLLDTDHLRCELESLLRLPPRVEEQPAPTRWQLLTSFLRILPTRGAA